MGDAVGAVVEVLEVRIRLPVAGEGVRLRHNGGEFCRWSSKLCAYSARISNQDTAK